MTRITVQQKFFGRILGKKGSNIKRIKERTQTEIHFLRSMKDEKLIDCLIEKGTEEKRKLAARLILASTKQLTHFINIPLNMNHEIDSAIQSLIQSHSHLRNTLIKPAKLHLTLAVMSLTTDQIKECIKVLKSIPFPKLDISFGDLKVLRGSMKSASLVYVQVISKELESYANSLLIDLESRNLIPDSQVQLHCTLLNGNFPGAQAEFDATEIILKESFKCGNFKPKEIHLSKFMRTHIYSNLYYEPEFILFK